MSHSIIVPFRYPDPIEYREISGFPGYRVGNDGTVWSCWMPRKRWLTDTWIRKSVSTTSRGYFRVTLAKDGVKSAHMVHRIVAVAFFGDRGHDGLEVCHGPDVTKTNNCTVNLRWDTHAENMAEAKVGGLLPIGSQCKKATTDEATVTSMRAMRKSSGLLVREIAELHGVSFKAADAAIRGDTWKHVKEEAS